MAKEKVILEIDTDLLDAIRKVQLGKKNPGLPLEPSNSLMVEEGLGLLLSMVTGEYQKARRVEVDELIKDVTRDWVMLWLLALLESRTIPADREAVKAIVEAVQKLREKIVIKAGQALARGGDDVARRWLYQTMDDIFESERFKELAKAGKATKH